MVFLCLITSANTHNDVTVAIDTVDSIVIKRLSSSSSSKLNYNQKKQNLCLDKAYHSKEIEQEIVKRGYIPHIRHTEENKKREYLIENIIEQEDGL